MALGAISDVEWGRILASLEEINRRLDRLEDRTIYRLDNLEDRVEILEVAKASRKFSESAWDRAVWGFVGAGLVALCVGFATAIGIL